jgi:hypothetical protein
MFANKAELGAIDFWREEIEAQPRVRAVCERIAMVSL